MNYSFDRLGADAFENMVQSLIQNQLGINTQIFGDGPDGQREAYIENGNLTLDGKEYSGKMFFQMKYKEPDGKEKDWSWLQTQLKKELESFRKKKKQEPEYLPKVWLFFTNVSLTPVKDIGLRDKANALVKTYSDVIPQIVLCGPDEIRALLDNNRNVATAYASFILPGDILLKMNDILSEAEAKPHEALAEYAKIMLRENRYARLTQAGDRIDTRIDLSDIYVDMDIEIYGSSENELRLTETFIQIGNVDFRCDGSRKNDPAAGIFSRPQFADYEGYRDRSVDTKLRKHKYVVIAEAGQGKSTFCQYICQMYRAAFISSDQVTFAEAMPYLSVTELPAASCRRYPFQIELRKYAGWIEEQDGDISVLAYLTYQMNRYGADITKKQLEKVLEAYSWLFIFDGLDEVPVTANRDAVLEQINQFTDFEIVNHKCDALIICTSRPQGYTNDFHASEYTHLRISHMSEDTAKDYLEKLLEYLEPNTEERAEQKAILFACMNDQVKSKLMETPLQITIMAIIVKTGGTPPNNRYLLFSDYVDTIIKREKQRGLLPKICDEVRWIRSLHEKIAFQLQWESSKNSNVSALLEREDLKAIIAAYLQEESDEEEPEKIDRLTDELHDAMIIRLSFLAEIEDSREGYLIRSMQEYFAAEYTFDEFQEDKIILFLREIAPVFYWRNVFLFATGYIAEKRKSLLSVIEQICHELNGSENLPGEYSVTSIAKQGSYLALDILKDSIFLNMRMQTKYLNIAAEVIYEDMPLREWEFVRGMPDRLIPVLLEKYVVQGLKSRKDTTDIWALLLEFAVHGNELAMEIMAKEHDAYLGLPYRLYMNNPDYIRPFETILSEEVLAVFDQYVLEHHEKIHQLDLIWYAAFRKLDTREELVPHMFWAIQDCAVISDRIYSMLSDVWKVLSNYSPIYDTRKDYSINRDKISTLLSDMGIEEYIDILDYYHMEQSYASFMNMVKKYYALQDPAKRKYALRSLRCAEEIHQVLSMEIPDETELYDFYMNEFTENEYNQIKRVENLCTRDQQGSIDIWEETRNTGIEYLSEIIYKHVRYWQIGYGIEEICFQESFERCNSAIRMINDGIARNKLKITDKMVDFYLDNADLILSQPQGIGAMAAVLAVAPVNKMIRFYFHGMVRYRTDENGRYVIRSYYGSEENADRILKAVDFQGGCSSLLQMLPLFARRLCSTEYLKEIRSRKIHIDYTKASNRLEEAISLFCYIIFADEADDRTNELEMLKHIILSSQDVPEVYFALCLLLNSLGDDKQVIRLVTHMAGYLTGDVCDNADYKMLRRGFIQSVRDIQVDLSPDIRRYIHGRLNA